MDDCEHGNTTRKACAKCVSEDDDAELASLRARLKDAAEVANRAESALAAAVKERDKYRRIAAEDNAELTTTGHDFDALKSANEGFRGLLVEAVDFAKSIQEYRCHKDMEEGDAPLNVCDYHFLDDLVSRIDAALAQPCSNCPETEKSPGEVAVPGKPAPAEEPCPDDCQRCSGEFCETHGTDPCECDTAERHDKPTEPEPCEPCGTCGGEREIPMPGCTEGVRMPCPTCTGEEETDD